MKYNKINNIDCSYVGLGYMRFNPNDQDQINSVVDYAIQQGVNYFESCNFYLNGRCEEIVAKSLSRYNREDYVLCGKMPIRRGSNDLEPLNLLFEKQLKNCNTEYFDVYLLQALDRTCFQILLDTKILQFLIQKKKEGKIRALGFSFHDTADVFEKYLKLYDWDCCQIQLNYYDWFLGEAKAIYELTEKYNVPAIVMGPTKGGTLINYFPQDMDTGWLLPIRYALDFFKGLPNVKVILNGTPQIGYLKQNICILNDETDMTDMKFLENVINKYRENSLIDCTSCGYCLDHCPQKIPINRLFTLYNKAVYGNKEALKEYRKIQSSQYGTYNCMRCGQCERFCPQHLSIRRLFHDTIFPYRL